MSAVLTFVRFEIEDKFESLRSVYYEGECLHCLSLQTPVCSIGSVTLERLGIRDNISMFHYFGGMGKSQLFFLLAQN